MDLLWLSNETPDREGGGGQRRQYHQIVALIAAGIRVTVATIEGPQSDSSIRVVAPTTRLRPGRRGRHDLPSLLADVRPKKAIVAHVETVPNVAKDLDRANVPFLVDFHNVFSRWAASRGADNGRRHWEEREREALRVAAHATVCSAQESAALTAFDTGTPIDVAPHGVAPYEWPEGAAGEVRDQTVALFGSWLHEPNTIAAEWLAAEIWPNVLAQVPRARLLFLGPGVLPDNVVGGAGVTVMGRVDDLAAALARVRVAVVPIRDGVGARVKFIESLASGAAVVSTTLGSEGFDVNGAFVHADLAEDFADACVRLLSAPSDAEALGRRGRELAFSRYTWPKTTRPLLEFVLSK